MKEINQETFSGERALYNTSHLHIIDSVFMNGESPLKECSDITVENSLFKWRYPIWYCKDVDVSKCTFFVDSRAGMWYVDGLKVSDSMIASPKNLRRCKNVHISNTNFSDSDETLWHCSGVQLDRVTVKGEYFAMNSEELKINELALFGQYSFDGCRNVEITNSRLMTKDAFWNSENVTVRDSFISGEYLGWNSKKITLINCTVESIQGLCYIENLVMKNCRLINTTLAFEYSSVDAQIDSDITSVFNPKSGTIEAHSIGELIVEKNRATESVRITCSSIKKRSDHPDWITE